MKMNAQNKKLVMAFSIAIAVLVIVAGCGLTIFEVYYKVNDSKPVRFLAKTFDLPAARVGKYKVSFDRFVKTRDAVIHFINSDAGKEVKATMPPQDVLDKNVLDRLLRQLIVQEMAEQKKIAVTDDEVKTVFADVVKAAASSTTPNVSEYLSNNYGWNENDFRSQVLLPALLEQKVGMELAKEMPTDQNALETAITARRASPDVVIYLKF